MRAPQKHSPSCQRPGSEKAARLALEMGYQVQSPERIRFLCSLRADSQDRGEKPNNCLNAEMALLHAAHRFGAHQAAA